MEISESRIPLLKNGIVYKANHCGWSIGASRILTDKGRRVDEQHYCIYKRMAKSLAG